MQAPIQTHGGLKRASVLDGTEQMEPVAHKMVLVDGEKITAIVEENAPCEGYEKVDLKGGYLMPGLINLHVHLAGNGRAKQDSPAWAGIEAGIAGRRDHHPHRGRSGDFSPGRHGKGEDPAILAANEGISVPGGHGSLAAHDNFPQPMNRGGRDDPGVLEKKKLPEMVRAVCDEAHRLGYPVAAHTESPEGVKVALENGVESMAQRWKETIRLYRCLLPGAALCAV